MEAAVANTTENHVGVCYEVAAGVDKESSARAANVEAAGDLGLVGSPGLARSQFGREVRPDGGGIDGGLHADDGGAQSWIEGKGPVCLNRGAHGPRYEHQPRKVQAEQQDLLAIPLATIG
jgi:hypothetical protein